MEKAYNFVFAAGLESGRLASYRVNADTGVLEELQTFTVGNRPMWVPGIGSLGSHLSKIYTFDLREATACSPASMPSPREANWPLPGI